MSLVVSVSPDKLEKVRSWNVDIELKFDWEHESLLRGDRDLETHLSDVGMDLHRICSVHLPPGIGRTRKDVEMALTKRNRGTITRFVHDQLEVVPDAHLVVHPPKSFSYIDQLEVIATVIDLTGREIAIENTSVESDWYTPEAIAFFGYAGQRYDRLEGLSLTIDTAHLPALDAPHVDALDPNAMSTLEEALELPPGFETELDRRLENLKSWLPADQVLSDLNSHPYGWTLRALCLAGDSVREVHLNDPVTDDVPAPSPHNKRPLLEAILNWAHKHDVAVVLEPGSTSTSELHERAMAIREILEDDGQ